VECARSLDQNLTTADDVADFCCDIGWQPGRCLAVLAALNGRLSSAKVSVGLITASVGDDADANISMAANSLIYKHDRSAFLNQLIFANIVTSGQSHLTKGRFFMLGL